MKDKSPSGPVHQESWYVLHQLYQAALLVLSHESARRKNQCFLAPDISTVLVDAVLASCSVSIPKGTSVWGFQ